MPRAGLTPARVAAEAADLADAEGFAALTLAAVAARVNVRVPSLYKHVDGLAGLRREVAVLGILQMTEAITAATVGRTGADALAACCRAYRAYVLDHPGRYAAIQRAPDRDDPAERELAERGDRLIGVLVDVLRGFALDTDDVVHAVRILRSAVHGFVSVEQLGGFGLPTDVEASFDRLIEVLAAGFGHRPANAT